MAGGFCRFLRGLLLRVSTASRIDTKLSQGLLKGYTSSDLLGCSTAPCRIRCIMSLKQNLGDSGGRKVSFKLRGGSARHSEGSRSCFSYLRVISVDPAKPVQPETGQKSRAVCESGSLSTAKDLSGMLLLMTCQVTVKPLHGRTLAFFFGTWRATQKRTQQPV